ncbi:MAG: penicillin-binding protein 3 [Porticoccaceae bacterium]|nr:MAG: penicillin-binding protein 3 [Porticoccaceae bacterium]
MKDGGRPARNAVCPLWRRWLVVGALGGMAAAALVQVARLQVVGGHERDYRFLQRQGEARTVRHEEIPASRGVITDRRGEPLAVSTPVLSLVADPKYLWPAAAEFSRLAEELKMTPEALAQQLRDGDAEALIGRSRRWAERQTAALALPEEPRRRALGKLRGEARAVAAFAALARALGEPAAALAERLGRYRDKRFVYLARHLPPERAEAALAAEAPGVSALREFRRFYPAGEVAAQLVGYTDIDGRGQEGIERAFDASLAGSPGVKAVLKDRTGRTVRELALIRAERPGRDLALSIDLRLQYLAYRELKAAVARHRAAGGSVVVLDAHTGEVLAMVNQPSFNPNDRDHLRLAGLRNRALTDLVEPGSTVKPLTMAAALEAGVVTPSTQIDTNPGYLWVAGKTFRDHSNYGVLDLRGILQKSSQVGTTRIALEMEPERIRGLFARFGLGSPPGTGFPGESAGRLPDRRRWRTLEHVTLAFGYGIAASPLQLAQAYAVLANEGVRRPVSLLKREVAPAGKRVLDADVARTVRDLLCAVTEPGGTGTRAAIPGYRVAGKTGTSHKVGPNGYEAHRYVGLFAGMVPAEHPRLVTVVVIDDPRGKEYFGGAVAAPVFARVNAEALRLLGVPPGEGGRWVVAGAARAGGEGRS